MGAWKKWHDKMALIDFTIEESDKLTPLWRLLVAHYEARLQSLREQNDGTMDQDARNKLIGQIAEVKRFLKLNEKPKLQESHGPAETF